MLRSTTRITFKNSAGATVVMMPGIVPALAVTGAFAVVLSVLRHRSRRAEPSARQILDRRLARGEITRPQYDEIRAAIEG
ncbi:hypothetical protein BH24CHL7_BH24CHL7_15030 [soil metagenome]|jgi:uncharacterized membrane protein